jgi:UDP-N-acetylmuramate dehydrogenase
MQKSHFTPYRVELSPKYAKFLSALPAPIRSSILLNEPLYQYTTLRVGGPADIYYRATNSEYLAEAAQCAQQYDVPCFLLGGGSNVCISDKGVRGFVLHNACNSCDPDEITSVDTGYLIMRLFFQTAKRGLSGLEFAVGIPGTVGGALVSNAGAYRKNICDLVLDLDVVENGERKKVGKEWMEFSYRDSRLRRPDSHRAVVISCRLTMHHESRETIMAQARDNQRQRIYKQPWYPSAGSFFKNVNDTSLAMELEGLPSPLRDAGVVPAGFLNTACGCKGLRVGGAEISARHANFIVNRGNATAADIRRLAGIVRQRVKDHFGVDLSEEALYVGDWSGWEDDE